MVSPLAAAPAIVLLLALSAWVGNKARGRPRRLVGRVARRLFGRFVSANPTRRRRIRAAYIDETYRTYAAKTHLFTLLGLLGGAAAGAYLTVGLLLVLEPLLQMAAQLPNTITSTIGLSEDFELVLSEEAFLGIVSGGAVVTGVLVAVGAYLFRWRLPESEAEVRRRAIDEGLPRTVAFTYALARGGMSVPDVFRTLGHNSEVYGETARELTVATREMDLFGRDAVTALRRMARRTPSDRFKTFAENLASVLQSGSDLPDFLRTQYDRFQQEAEERQADLIELLATIAEAYVTVLVAGVLFLITILMVFGLTTTDTLWLLQLLAYAIIPLANAGFALYLIQKLETLGVGASASSSVLDRYDAPTPVRPDPSERPERADGGVARDSGLAPQLRLYDRVERFKGALASPVTTLVWNPTAILYVVGPIALLLLLVRLPSTLQAAGVHVRGLDDLIVQSTLLVLIAFAVLRELYKRRIARIEAATPELLERLASLNEAGMTMVEGLDRVRGSDLGALDEEVERIWRDVRFGANVDDALIRFGRRVRTRSVTRVVVLVTNAMRASGAMGDVIRIAADQARADLRMRRNRRQEMFTYLVVIYVAFAVFLVIILAIDQVLVPSLPQSVPTPDPGQVNRLGVNVDQFARIGRVDKAAYTLVFFHTALIQAVCSGFIAGLLGEGTLRDGAKHAAVLLAVAYVAFTLLSAPVASIAAGTQTPGSSEIELDRVSLSEGGYVVVHEDGVNSTVLGRSTYLEPGTHHDVTIALPSTIDYGDTYTVVPHRETNGNQQFDFPGPPHRPGTGQVDRPYSPLSAGAEPGIEIQIFRPTATNVAR